MQKSNALRALLATLGIAAGTQLSFGTDVPARSQPSFNGRISISAQDSTPDWPKPVKAPAGAPNIVLIMLDDVGFADTSTFGGAAQTPVLDGLAAEGLRYNRFHTTGLCSPTRAALLSGRNHHRMGSGTVGEAGFPGYNGIWKASTASVAKILRLNGYSTAAFGKWHNTPFREISPIGPFERWPTGLGFDYYYGNMLGVSSQWEPKLWRNTLEVRQPRTAAEGYHYTTDITDEAIQWLGTQRSFAPDTPYFIYFATGAAHSPHHVPADWIRRYKGKFDQGWERLREENFARQKQLGVIPPGTELTPLPGGLPAWDGLSSDQKRIAARQMEVYAGFIAHTDYQIGRLIEAIKAAPSGENTLILYIVGDNGASGEVLEGAGIVLSDSPAGIDELGSESYRNGYAAGWAVAGSAPFQGTKGVASHFGGTRNPLVVSWPARIRDKGGLRTQFAHVTDVAATLFDVAGIRIPDTVDGVEQLALDGFSFAATFDHAKAPSRHRIQYFETWGNRAIYNDGWIAAARHKDPWESRKPAESFDLAQSYDDDEWELYNVDEDFSEARNLGAKHQRKLQELKTLFETEARRNDVYPLFSNNLYGQLPAIKKTKFTLYAGLPIPAFNAPSLSGPFRIEADVVIPAEGASGVVFNAGSQSGGVVLYLKDDHLVCEYRSNFGHVILISEMPVPRGEATLALELLSAQRGKELTGVPRGVARLYVNRHLAGEQNTDFVDPSYGVGEFIVGQVFASSVSDKFKPPFRFTGTLKRVQLELN